MNFKEDVWNAEWKLAEKDKNHAEQYLSYLLPLRYTNVKTKCSHQKKMNLHTVPPHLLKDGANSGGSTIFQQLI